MQAAGRGERSAIDNLIIMNTITENQRAQKQDKYMLFAVLLSALINCG